MPVPKVSVLERVDCINTFCEFFLFLEVRFVPLLLSNLLNLFTTLLHNMLKYFVHKYNSCPLLIYLLNNEVTNSK